MTQESLYGFLVTLIKNNVVINGNGCGIAPIVCPKPLLARLGEYKPFRFAGQPCWYFEGTALANALYDLDVNMSKDVLKDF